MMKELHAFDVFSLIIITTTALADTTKHFICKPYQIVTLTLFLIDGAWTPLLSGGSGIWMSEDPRVFVPSLPKGRVDI